MSQNQGNGAVAIAVALIGLVGVIGAALINATLGNQRNSITSNNTVNNCIYYKVTRPYGLYLFEMPNIKSAILGTLPYNFSVEVDKFHPNNEFTKVYSSQYGSGWVASEYLRCDR